MTPEAEEDLIKGLDKAGIRTYDKNRFNDPAYVQLMKLCIEKGAEPRPNPSGVGVMAAVMVDLVNHPPHYKSGGLESIDIIEAFGLNFHLGNVVKYILRHEKKGGLESLKKAQWYLNREIERREKIK